ncbi:hypothetical protein NliqN6_2924 [Naganishia liquefaciens]|uniref:Uncharacterized protein n=1 Tax=Naganishia liquefaciens TaxID=104408 RepID=A0A8H3TSS6_9TREE|nr:hypothetical protein NliqN6_2924 [Naganishia liquefaciens]
MSSQNAGTQSPKQQKQDPMGAADTEGQKGQGLGAEQRAAESSGADQQKTGVSDEAVKTASDVASKIADPTSARHEQ